MSTRSGIARVVARGTATRIIAAGVVGLFLFVSVAQGQVKKKPAIDLNGTWTTDDGGTVKVTHNGQSVTATFISGGGCPYGGGRGYFFKGTLQGTSLEGTMMACTRTKFLIDDCHLESVYETKFRATIGDDVITGQRFAEGWAYDEKDGHYLNCHRDDGFNSWKDFSLKRACDPKLWADYERKKKVAKELFERSNKMGEEIVTEASNYFKEEMGMMGEIAVVKGPILARIESMHEWGLEHMAQTRGDLAQAYLNGSRVTGAVVKGVEVYGSIIPTALWLTEMGEKSMEIDKEMQAREKMSQQAAALLDSALRDFKADFNQRKVCEGEQDRLNAEEAIDDKAKALMDKWDYSPSGDLYRTPADEVLTSAAALNKARDIVTGKSSSKVRREPIFELAAFSTEPPEDFKVSCDQLAAAIAEIDHAMKSFDLGMKTMEQYYGGEGSHSEQVSTLLHQFGQTGDTADSTKTTGGAVKASTVPKVDTPKVRPARPKGTLRP